MVPNSKATKIKSPTFPPSCSPPLPRRRYRVCSLAEMASAYTISTPSLLFLHQHVILYALYLAPSMACTE